MARVFVSYRRKDSPYSVGRICDRLADILGQDNVFKDVDSIKGGSDFALVIERQLDQSDAIIVVIGPHWLSLRTKDGRLRLNDPDDLVRKEIELALKKRMKVIPVLVDAAELPTREELPQSIADLVNKNAVEVRPDPDFKQDINRLIDDLNRKGPSQDGPKGGLVRLTCPKCQGHPKIHSSMAGKRVRCPYCTATLLVDDPCKSLSEIGARSRPPATLTNQAAVGGSARLGGAAFYLMIAMFLLMLTALILVGGGMTWWFVTHPTQPGAKTDPAITPAPAVVLRGSGSTFIDPLMQHWAGIYEKKQNVRIEYKGVGSSKGVDGVIDRLFPLGCSDPQLTEEQRAKAKKEGGDLIQIPLALGAIVPAYNLPSVQGKLRFTGPILADIYLGKIESWDDPALRAANPGVLLPKMRITTVHRSDSSGTTSLWTAYLSKVNGEFRDSMGSGPRVKWPSGLEGKGNGGVANMISENPGAIGYVELAFALENNLKFGPVKNRAGKFVEPTQDSVTAAAAAVTDIPADLGLSLIDAPGPGTYPIVGTTHAVLYADQLGNPSGRELVAFLRWATHEGQAYVRDLNYAPLPPELVQRIDTSIANVRLPKQ